MTYEVKFLEFDHYGRISHSEILGNFGVENGKVAGLSQSLEDYIKKGDTVAAAMRHFPSPYYQVFQVEEEQI